MTPRIIMWERDWESMAALEAAYERSGADPEQQELGDQPSPVVSENAEIVMAAR